MQRRSFIAGLAALFAAKKLPASGSDKSFELEYDHGEPYDLVYQEELHRNAFFSNGHSVIGMPAHLVEIEAMENMSKGEIAVIDTNTGKARKAKYESDLIMGVIVGPSMGNKYIIAVH
jgi:hypothetical protein